MSEKLFFDTIKECRNGYFVEYCPPIVSNQFAMLALVMLHDFTPVKVKKLMELELQYWLRRYPVPLMVSASDSMDNLIDIDDNNFLVGWFTPGTNEINTSWQVESLDNFVKNTSIKQNFAAIYKDIPYKTAIQVRQNAMLNAKQQAKQIRVLKSLNIIWIAVIPAGIAIYEFWGPKWVSIIALIYGIWKPFDNMRRIIGLRKLTRKELEKQEIQRKKDHYYYHCERNPNGFLKLMIENLEKERQEEILTEADDLIKK